MVHLRLPRSFLQLYTIHVLHKSMYVQVVYYLLPLKTTDIYEKMWHLIKTLCKTELKPQNIFLDFELSAHNGVLCIFLNAQINVAGFISGKHGIDKLQNWDLKLNTTKVNQKFHIG